MCILKKDFKKNCTHDIPCEEVKEALPSVKKRHHFQFSDKTQNRILNFTIVVLVVAYLFLFVIRIGLIQSGSMEPTIMTDDITIDNAMAYVIKEPQRGDVVSFYSDELDMVICKRVIGIGGDTISFKHGYVYLNGEKLDESAYLDETVRTFSFKEFEVPDGYVFCLGDHRRFSNDSRLWDSPYVNIDDIKSKLVFVIPMHLLKAS